MDKITPSQFWSMLNNHDWFYYMADSLATERKGHEAEGKLMEIASTSPELQALFDDFKAAMFSGPAFGKESIALPKKPLTDSVNGATVKVGDNDF